MRSTNEEQVLAASSTFQVPRMLDSKVDAAERAAVPTIVCALEQFHRAHGRIATVTAVRPPARFGNLTLEGAAVREFAEKPQTDEGWINGGFFVFNPAIFDYLENDDTVLEKEPLERLAAERQLMAFRHPGFWQPMDTLREKMLLDSLWSAGQAPWKVWA